MSHAAPLGLLEGARLQGVRSIAPAHVQLGWYLPHDAADAAGAARVWLDLAVRDGAWLCVLSEERRSQRPRPTGFAMALRRDVVGARLVSAHQTDGHAQLRLQRGETTWLLCVRAHGRAAGLRLWRDGDLHVTAGVHSGDGGEALDALDAPAPGRRERGGAEAWKEALSLGLDAHAAFERAALDARVRRLQRSVRQHARRLRRRLKKIEADAGRADEAPALRLDAEVLKTALHRVPRGASEVVLPAPWLPGEERTITLRPEEAARDAVDRLFRRARGLEEGAERIAQRWTQTEAALEALDALREALTGLLSAPPDNEIDTTPSQVASSEALERAEARARELGVRPPQRRSHPPRSQGRGGRRALPSGVDAFVAPSGAPMFVGRHAAANDAILKRLARGRDVWMHVRERPGAHLVLRVHGREEPGAEDIRAATQLVAHRSGVGPGEHADVIVAEVRQVRRVAGARPGQVTVGAHRVVAVKLDKPLVDALYARRDGA